ncbi:MAG: undecaprenyl-phosphate glucose phosphotransferase [Burkholderiales bacterium]|nr:undecaprenyl-phosphate glucose phosphotransferase [Burkholderiales bacterium]
MSDEPVHQSALPSPLGEIPADQGGRSQASGRLSTPMGNASHNLMWMLRSLVDPTITLLTLLTVALVVQGGVRNRDILLAVIAFSLSYPGSIGFAHRPRRLLRQIFGSWGALCGLMLLFGLATDLLRAFDPNILAAWVIGTPVLQAIAHQTIPSLLTRVRAISEHDRAVIIGANELGRTLARALLADPLEDTRVTAFFDDRTPARLGETLELPVRRGLENVADFVREQHIDRIYIALPMASQPRILNLLDQLRDTTASIYFLPDIFLYDLIQARVDTVGGLPVVAVCETPFHGTTGVIKRLSDLCIALPAIVITGPVMLAIALAIKLTMPGPVLFRQRRYGLDGEQIVVWKFRSMRVSEDGEVVRQATRHDDRITPLGAFLRRSSLDELPQFFNVLQGRMSVVGPRPHAVAHNEMYRKLIKGYMIRHKVKPGITGWAQVNGARGETDTIEKMQRRIAYDIEYLRSWSLRLDAAIVWRTITQAVRGDQNAY